MIKKTLLLFNIFLLANINSLYSQVTITEIEKIEEKIISKPVAYDSINDWGNNHEKVSDYKQYIGLQIYLPPKFERPDPKNPKHCVNNFLFSLKRNDSLKTFVYKPFTYNYSEYMGSYEPIRTKTIVCSDPNEINNTYFTILDVIYGEKLHSYLSSLERIEYDSECQGFKTIRDYMFLLKNDKTGDLLYSPGDNFRGRISHDMDFILVPYFVKQKSLYQGVDFIFDEDNTHTMSDSRQIEKYEDNSGYEREREKVVIINPKSKWRCSDVTLLKPSYELHYILNNDKGEQIALTTLSGFIDAKSYTKREADKKQQYQQLAAKNKQEELLTKEKEKRTFEKHRYECISKFGQQTGELIAHGKVRINMTKEMCKDSWGTPFSSDKTITESEVYEDWYYWYGYRLHFVNGLLKRIDE